MDSDIVLGKDGFLKLRGDSFQITHGEGAELRGLIIYQDGTVAIQGNPLGVTNGAIEGNLRKGFELDRDGMIYVTGNKVYVNTGKRLQIVGDDFEISAGELLSTLLLGSRVAGRFNGYSLIGQTSPYISGDNVTVSADKTEIGRHEEDKGTGITVWSNGRLRCDGYIAVHDPGPNESGDRESDQEKAALSQSEQDELVLNSHGFYEGGTRIDGDLNVSGNLTVRTSLNVPMDATIVLQTPSEDENVPGIPVDVRETITSLLDRIAYLENRIAKLESRVP